MTRTEHLFRHQRRPHWARRFLAWLAEPLHP
jgi:hypothetical protein